MIVPDEHDVWGVLAGTDLFAGLSGPLLEPFARLAKIGRFQDGELVFASGQTGSAIYVLTKGMASVELPMDKGIYQVIQLFGPRKALGWCGLRPDGTYIVSVRSLMDSEAVVLPLQEFDAVLGENADVRAIVSSNLMTIMYEHIEALVSQIAPEAPRREHIEHCPLSEGRQFTWRSTSGNTQGHCVGETCSVTEGRDCPLAGRSPLEWHQVLPHRSSRRG